MSNTAPINAQIASNAPIPNGLAPVTAPLVPDQGVLTLMSNFPPQTYNKSLGASIVKLMSTLTGPSGGGQLRQRSLVDRLRSSVSSTYYTDLDNSLGAVLGISRQLGESLPINPYTTVAPSTGPGSWLAMSEADATYRDRLFQVLRAVSTYGPTLDGIKLIAESFLLSPVEVTEYFHHSTATLAANPPLAYYITVTPHITPTPQQTYGLMKILNKIKPAQSTIILAPPPAVAPYTQVNLRGASASSFYWEVQSVSSALSIYGSTAVPQYAFGSSQAATWTVNGWVSGALSYANDVDGTLYSSTDFEQVTWADGTITNYSPIYAMASTSAAVLGTMVIPGNATANPLNPNNGTVSPLLLSGAPVSAIQSSTNLVAQSTPQFWSTPERDYTDMTADIIETRFSSPVNINAVSFQLANFPHTATFQVYDDPSATWVAYYSQTVATSVPSVLPNPSAAFIAKTHPQHFGPGHWVSVAFRFAPTSFSRARIVLMRPGVVGPTGPISAVTNAPTAYSLGVTEFSFDYIVDSADQLPDGGTVSLAPIGSSTDIAGNTITYSVYSEVPTVTPFWLVAPPTNRAGTASTVGTFTALATGVAHGSGTAFMTGAFTALATGVLHPGARATGVFTGLATGVATISSPRAGTLGQWRCFPQPVNNAVALLYLDTRDGYGNPQTIDRFFITPTHLGVACTLYFAIDEPGTPGDMTTVAWILVNRQYMLMTGWMVVPPTAAKYWKFEMSGLVAEPLSNPFPVTADTLLFGTNAIVPVVPSAGYQGALPPGATTQAAIAAGESALTIPSVNSPPSGTFSPATALVAADPTLAQALQSTFANYGYIDWQPFGAPPVTIGGLESYTVSSVASVNMVGFFTGFSSIVAYRSNPACPIDTPLYYEGFYDASQIASSNAVTVGGIYSGVGVLPYPDNNPQFELLATPVVVTSNAYVSASMVTKVQFATVQSPPAEIVPFDTFRNGRYLPPPQGTYTWNDQEDWNIVGMGDAQVNFNAQTLTPVIVRGGTSYTGPQANGIVSGQFQTSPKGFIAVAVRLSILSVPPSAPQFFVTNPIYLQLCQWFGDGTTPPHVVVEWPLSALTVGQTIEEYFSYQIGSAINSGTFLCLAVAQHSGAYPPSGQTASWVVQAASVFDPSIVWSFSGDGVNWVDASSVNPVRNNSNGVVSISTNPGPNLYYRCTIYRPDMFVTNLKIRPWYTQTDMPRQAPLVQGPNMTFSDPDQTIWSDPEFNTWTSPVPIWWFAKYQQSFGLYPDGVPVITRSSKVYGQTIVETVGPATDTAKVTFYQQMMQAPTTVGPADMVSVARVTYHATTTDTIGPATDVPVGTILVSPHSTTFSYTGALQQFTVPGGCQSITAVMAGGGGGGAAGGAGGIVNFTFPVTNGQVLNVYVGGQGGTYSNTAGAGWPYGYHVGGAPYDMLSNNLTYGGPGNYGTIGFGGGSSAVALSSGTLVAEAGGGGGQGWLYGVQEVSYSQTFSYTGGLQTLPLPSNIVGPVTITCTGGGGGNSTGPAYSGQGGAGGAVITATVNVTPGQTLNIYVGGAGGNGYSGGQSGTSLTSGNSALTGPGGYGYGYGGSGLGIPWTSSSGTYSYNNVGSGGGGGSAVLAGGTPLVVAGGGGGAPGYGGPDGGLPTAGTGGAANGAGGTGSTIQDGNTNINLGIWAYGGTGGSPSGAGTGGGYAGQVGSGGSSVAAGTNGNNGSGAAGGNGVVAPPTSAWSASGGAGGGYYGGGSGSAVLQAQGFACAGGAGGGGSFVASGATGVSSGTSTAATNGSITVAYNLAQVAQNFVYTGGSQTFTCPSNPQGGTVTVSVQGGAGGAGAHGTDTGPIAPPAGGLGGVVTATIPVVPNQVLTIVVGAQGGAGNYYPPGYVVPASYGYHSGGNGDGASGAGAAGAGGGSSAVLIGGTLYAEAGGGGGGASGASYDGTYYGGVGAGGNGGGTGGNPSGQNGAQGGTVGAWGTGGGGASQSAAGTAGTGVGGTVAPIGGNPGSGGTGGNSTVIGGIGTGGNAYASCSGGGGGGFFGGGSGGNAATSSPGYSGDGGGGGGSSWGGNGATGVTYSVATAAGNGTVNVTYTPGSVPSTAYNYAFGGGAGGATGAGGQGSSFGSAVSNGGAGATQSAGGAGGTWTSVQPSGTTSGTAPAGTFDGAILTNGTNGGSAYPYSGGGGGGGGYAGGGAGSYSVYIVSGVWNTNQWSGGGGGSSWAGGIATSISYGSASTPGNGSIIFNYLSVN